MGRARKPDLTQACDNVVELVLAGRRNKVTPEDKRAILRMFRHESLYADFDFYLAPFDSFPEPESCWLSDPWYGELALRVMSAQRIEAIIREEEAPTADERMLFQLAFVEVVTQDPSMLDARECLGCSVFCIRHSDGHRAIHCLISTAGYRFTGVRRKFHGFYATKREMEAHLDRIGLAIPSKV